MGNTVPRFVVLHLKKKRKKCNATTISFVAVTICPETKANMTQLNFTDVFHKMASALKPPYNITEEEYVEIESNFRKKFFVTITFASGKS